MSLVTLECLDDGNTIDVPVDKTVIGRGSFLKVFSQESEVLSIIRYRGTSKIAGQLLPSDLRGAPIPYY